MASLIITIDGPAASGKSTVARLLAQRLGAVFLDTGAMYRGVTLAAMRKGVRLSDEQALLDVLNNTKFEFRADVNGMSVFVDEVDVTAVIRQQDVTENSRYIAAAPKVRARLVEMQRDFAAEYEKVVTEGRDQGTVAFPNADVKFFLTADIETRAKRRLGELESTAELTLENMVRSIKQRDEKDSDRTDGPLKAADDAILIDTTDMNLDRVVGVLVSNLRS